MRSNQNEVEAEEDVVELRDQGDEAEEE
jgi:hypothetical protein